MVALVVTLGLCTFAAAALVWRYDLYDKEPWWALLAAAGAGAVGMWGAGVCQEGLARWVGAEPTRFALVAAVSEEAVKLAVVVGIARWLRRAFNDPVDGVIYGSVVGFGCAFIESVAYYVHPVARPWQPPVEVIRVMGHLIFGGLGGMGVGLVAASAVPRRRAWGWLFVGFGAAVGLHFAWDVQAARTLMRHGPTAADRVIQVGLMLTGMIAYFVALRRAWEAARERFAAGSWRGLLWTPTRRGRRAGRVARD